MKIKHIPEDFVVNEVSISDFSGSGRYLYCVLKKKNYTTVRAIECVASSLGIAVKRIGFAGAKDKNAVTTQLISLADVSEKRLGTVSIEGITLDVVGIRSQPLCLGDLVGNQFVITVRDLTDEDVLRAKRRADEGLRIPNYFGEQRFSTCNHLIGKALLKKDFKTAVELIVENGHGKEEDNVRDHLLNRPNDYVGALKTIHKKILQMYVHSYQSYLFNLCLDEFISSDGASPDGLPHSIPLVGFGTELKDDAVGKCIRDALAKDGVTQRDFIIRQIPFLSSEGDERRSMIALKDFSIESIGDDDCFSGRKKMVFSFELPKGCYATVVIDQLFKE